MSTDPEERAEKRAEEPNLELPSLFGLGRRKSRRPAGESSPAPQTGEPVAADRTDSEPGVAVPEPVSPEPAGPEPVSAAADAQVADPVAADPAAPPAGAAPDEPAQARPEDAPRDLSPALGRARRRPPVPPPTVPEAAVAAGSEPLGSTTTEPADAPHEGDGRSSTARTTLRLPSAPPVVATPLTGAVVGLLGVLMAYLAAQGCEVLRGVGSCGGIGALALSAIVLVEVLAGAVLLRALGVPEHTGTSVLGVGLTAVVALVFLLGSLMSVATIVVLPLLTAGCFLAAWWLMTAFTAPTVDDRLHR